MKGRGAAANQPNRFSSASGTCATMIHRRQGGHAPSCCEIAPGRSFTMNASPGVGFDASINPYRGCSHGCAYCYARPTHEYLGFSAGLDFETKIVVKEDAPELLWDELAHKRWGGRSRSA